MYENVKIHILKLQWLVENIMWKTIVYQAEGRGEKVQGGRGADEEGAQRHCHQGQGEEAEGARVSICCPT